MANIITRAGKGSALTWTEGDANLETLNNVKLEASNSGTAGQILSLDASGFVVWADVPPQQQTSITGIAGYGQRVIDEWDPTTYSSAKYFVQITDGTDIQVEEIAVIYDGTDLSFVEYGQLTNNGLLGNFTFNVNGSGNVRMIFVPTGATNMSIRIVKTLMFKN
jgi:hypothetical protein